MKCNILAAKAVLVLLGMLAAISDLTAQTTRSNLYIVAIGVSEHTNPKFNSGVICSAKDAIDVAAFFRGQQGKLYAKVETKVLTNKDVVLAKVNAALSWLKSKANANDTVIFYYSGHGGPDPKGQYHVNLTNFDPATPGTSLGIEPVRVMMENMPGKRFMIFDSCHSASSTGIGMPKQQVKQINGQGMVTMASSMSHEQSAEDAQKLKNGFFTFALLEALRGKADMNRDGMVTLAELTMYVSERVSNLSQGKQNTTVSSPATLPSKLPIAMVTVGGNNPPQVTQQPSGNKPGPTQVTQNPGVNKPAPAQPKTVALANTSWTGRETLAGYGNLGFSFQPEGACVMYDIDGVTRGTYTVSGNRVTLTFGGVTYQGTINGGTISGTARNSKTNWQFSVGITS